MAIRYDASTDTFTRSASVPSSTTYTASFWAYLVTDTNDWVDFFVLRDASYAQWSGLYLFSDGTSLRWSDSSGGAEIASTSLSLNQWYHIGISKNSGAVETYLDGVSDISITGRNSPTVTIVQVAANDGGGGNLNGRIAGLKIWSGSALTQAQLINESRSYYPRILTNLWFWNPLLTAGSATADLSGGGRTFTAGGTLTTEDGPAITLAPRRRMGWRAAAVAATFRVGGLMTMGAGR
jgi:Concanavalin A-like lectin/glucanases superfamily